MGEERREGLPHMEESRVFSRLSGWVPRIPGVEARSLVFLRSCLPCPLVPPPHWPCLGPLKSSPGSPWSSPSSLIMIHIIPGPCALAACAVCGFMGQPATDTSHCKKSPCPPCHGHPVLWNRFLRDCAELLWTWSFFRVWPRLAPW